MSGEAAGGVAARAGEEGLVAWDGFISQSGAGVGGAGLDRGLREGSVEAGSGVRGVMGQAEGAVGFGCVRVPAPLAVAIDDDARGFLD